MAKALYELNGWINREGKIHWCPPNGHKQKAEELRNKYKRYYLSAKVHTHRNL